eukprot:4397765-Pleurochrysis_carterae.AAC.6
MSHAVILLSQASTSRTLFVILRIPPSLLPPSGTAPPTTMFRGVVPSLLIAPPPDLAILALRPLSALSRLQNS